MCDPNPPVALFTVFDDERELSLLTIAELHDKCKTSGVSSIDIQSALTALTIESDLFYARKPTSSYISVK